MVGRGEGDGQLGGSGCVPLQGAIVVCYGGEGRVTTTFEGVDMVLGAIAGGGE